MKSLKCACWIAGIALAACLVGIIGMPAIDSAFRRIGWTGLAAISVFHLLETTLMGLAWWRLQRVGRRSVFIWARLVRDAGSEVLPLAQIGGYMLGARAVSIRGVPLAAAAASVVVDATVEFCAQTAYVTLGLTLLMSLLPGSGLVFPSLLGLGIALLAVAAFVVIQKRGSTLLTRYAVPLTQKRFGELVANLSAMQSQMQQIYCRRRHLWPSFILHSFAWMLCGIEGWLALKFMGARLSPLVVLAIDSLTYGVRAAAFLVPNAVGVQEGAYIMIGAALGLPPDLALALSLLKRGRDLILGVPALAVWQLFEFKQRMSGLQGGN